MKPRGFKGRPLGAGIGFGLLLAASCGSEGPRMHVHVTRAFQAESVQFAAGVERTEHGGFEFSLAEGAEGYWGERRLTAADWRAGPIPGLWFTARGLDALGADADGRAMEFELEGRRGRFVEWDRGAADPGQLRRGDWGKQDRWLVVFTSGAAPREARYRVYLPASVRENGIGHVGLPGLRGEGFALPTGADVELESSFRPRGRLRFSLAAAGIPSPEHPDSRVQVSVFLDGELLGSEVLPLAHYPELHRVALDLPQEGREGARLRFSVRGALAHVAVLSPVIGPAEVGRYGARPGELSTPKPDVVVFLADTLRADAVGSYRANLRGPQLDLTPNIDRFAEGARVYTRAFSPSSWTIPSHGSLFTGLAPEQHGAIRGPAALPRQLITFAERLRGHGYRTEANTDGGCVDPVFGMDQGFSVFVSRQSDERDQAGSLPHLLHHTRAALEADDGRPLLLFAHTYRVHTPYLVPEDALPLARSLYPFEGGWDGFVRKSALEFPELFQAGRPVLPGAAMAEQLAELRARYYGGVVGLDRGFGDFLQLLSDSGVSERGTVILTSDHGEAFGEFGTVFHGFGLHDDETRIPLLVRGPRFAPGLDPRPASLTDLTETIQELAGLNMPIPGSGRSLLRPAGERIVFQFVGLYGQDRRAAVDGDRRFSYGPDGALTVSHLPSDGPERLLGPPTPEQAARAGAVRAKRRALLDRFQMETEAASLEPWQQGQLRALGYFGD